MTWEDDARESGRRTFERGRDLAGSSFLRDAAGEVGPHDTKWPIDWLKKISGLGNSCGRFSESVEHTRDAWVLVAADASKDAI